MSQSGNGFELHPQLAKDCLVVGDLALDRVLLMNDANYPWLVLVPRRAGLRELYELDAADLAVFWQESADVGRRIMTHFGGGKLNVAALGNQVPTDMGCGADGALHGGGCGIRTRRVARIAGRHGVGNRLSAALPPNKNPPDFSRGVFAPEAEDLSWRDLSASSVHVREPLPMRASPCPGSFHR